jgi:hypothetical protein
VRPLTITIIAKVATNGWIDNRVIAPPLIIPMTAPVTIAAPTANDSPMIGINSTAVAPLSARIEPTLRSMPRPRMTKVMPTASIPSIDMVRATLKRFVAVRNVGESSEKMAPASTIPKKIAKREIASLTAWDVLPPISRAPCSETLPRKDLRDTFQPLCSDEPCRERIFGLCLPR